MKRLFEMQDKMCKEFCKYQHTIDENGQCLWMRKHRGTCPLDEITNILEDADETNV